MGRKFTHGNGDIVRARGRADQAVSAAEAEPDPKKFAEKWPSAMNMRAKVAEAAEDYPTANAYAAEVLKKFPKDPTALALFHETKGRAKGGAAPVAQAAPAPAFARAQSQSRSVLESSMAGCGLQAARGRSRRSSCARAPVRFKESRRRKRGMSGPEWLRRRYGGALRPVKVP